LHLGFAGFAQHLVKPWLPVGISIKAWRLADFCCKTVVSDSFPRERLEIRVKKTLAGAIKFFCQRVEIIGFTGKRPINAEPGTLREHGMHDHNGTSVSVQKRCP
jgi:hypothetical protein